MKRAITAALLLGLFTGGAAAADLIIEPQIISPAPAFSWQGFYAGVQGGWLAGTGTVDIPLYPSNFDVSTSGFVIGGHAGYNWELDSNLVLGVEGDVNWTNATGSAPSGMVGEEYHIDQTWFGSLRGRFGWAADMLLLYGTAGVAGTSLTTDYIPSFGPQSATVWGWTAGVGAELAFTDQVSARLEYRYTGYNTADFVHAGPSTVDYATHAVTAGVSFHF